MAGKVVITKEAKSTAYALALATLTGDWPYIDNSQPDYTTITLTNNQIEWGQDLFREMLTGDPTDVRFSNTGEIFLPVLKKEYWPWAVGAVGVGLLLGLIAGKITK